MNHTGFPDKVLISNAHRGSTIHTVFGPPSRTCGASYSCVQGESWFAFVGEMLLQLASVFKAHVLKVWPPSQCYRETMPASRVRASRGSMSLRAPLQRRLRGPPPLPFYSLNTWVVSILLCHVPPAILFSLIITVKPMHEQPSTAWKLQSQSPNKSFPFINCLCHLFVTVSER